MKKIAYFVVIIVFISLIIFMVINKKTKENIKTENNNIIIDNSDYTTEEIEKLKLLDNIHLTSKIFTIDKLDRYISYKQKNSSLSNSDIVLRVNMNLDKGFYSYFQNADITLNEKILVNKYNVLTKEYVPENLEVIDSKYSRGTHMVKNFVKENFENMARDALKEDYKIKAMSTYRSYSYQNNLYNNYLSRDGQKNADRYSARPGFSEHQTGLSLDIDNVETSFTNFSKTKEYGWMQKNAHKYGFIERYPKGKEDLTGYSYEAWHYRYVGLEIAKYIYENKITFDEYYYLFLAK